MSKSAGKPFHSALWTLGFRPFYLLAAVFASLALPLWMASYFGLVQWDGYLHGNSWHSHEMIFGFAPAVIAGFLLTAVRTWTGLPTPSGSRLAMLVALWIAARVANLIGPGHIAVLLDAVFLLMLGLAVGMPILRSKNRRNLKILLVLALLAGTNLAYQLASMGRLPADFMRLSLVAALDIITILMAIVGGRVIPAFTANAIPAAQPRQIRSLEVVALASLVLILAADIATYWLTLKPEVLMILFLLAALAHGGRLMFWQPHRTLGNPLLLMLPVAYAWIPVSLALRAVSQVSALPTGAATHALTIGAMASLMLAMMMRSALGHTGRKLGAGRVEIGAYSLLQVTAIARVGAFFISPVFYRTAMVSSAVLWSLAFILFLSGYWNILTRPRIDSRPG